jgi:hypothetical protein
MVSSKRVDRASARVKLTDVELGIKMDENLLPLPAAAAAGPAKSMTAFEVIDCFIVLDQDRNGEISHAEFIQGLKSNSQLAQKFGLEQNFELEDVTKEKYDLVFGQIDNDASKSINVCPCTIIPNVFRITVIFWITDRFNRFGSFSSSTGIKI